jgi:hypothetical protein
MRIGMNPRLDTLQVAVLQVVVLIAAPGRSWMRRSASLRVRLDRACTKQGDASRTNRRKACIATGEVLEESGPKLGVNDRGQDAAPFFI